MTTLINKVLAENEKRVFYFHLKSEGTFSAPKYTHTQRASRYTPAPPPPTHTHTCTHTHTHTHTHTQTHTLGFPGGSADKESSCNAGDLVSIPGLARSPGEGKGFWPGEFHGLYRSGGSKESDTTEQLLLQYTHTHTHSPITESLCYISETNTIL